MTAALEYHSIGVLSVFPNLHPRRSSDLSASILNFSGGKRGTWTFQSPIFVCILYPMSRCPWPGHVLPLVEGLAGYPFAFSKRRSSIRLLSRKLCFFLCHSSQTGSFHDPEELKHRSYTFTGQSKNHHANTYTSGLRAFIHRHHHNTFPSLKLLHSIDTLPHKQIGSSWSVLALSAYASPPRRFWASTFRRCTYSLVTSVLCRPGHVSGGLYWASSSLQACKNI
jgi:hypothetical protein